MLNVLGASISVVFPQIVFMCPFTKYSPHNHISYREKCPSKVVVPSLGLYLQVAKSDQLFVCTEGQIDIVCIQCHFQLISLIRTSFEAHIYLNSPNPPQIIGLCFKTNLFIFYLLKNIKIQRTLKKTQLPRIS